MVPTVVSQLRSAAMTNAPEDLSHPYACSCIIQGTGFPASQKICYGISVTMYSVCFTDIACTAHNLPDVTLKLWPDANSFPKPICEMHRLFQKALVLPVPYTRLPSVLG